MVRDRHTCRACGCAVWSPGNAEVDHVVPITEGGAPFDPDNCQTLCRGCHIAKTRVENQREPTKAERAWRALVDEL